MLKGLSPLLSPELLGVLYPPTVTAGGRRSSMPRQSSSNVDGLRAG